MVHCVRQVVANRKVWFHDPPFLTTVYAAGNMSWWRIFFIIRS